MKILIAPDKFKGSLPAAAVAAAIEGGLRRVLDEGEAAIRTKPIADGGDGTAEVLCEAASGSWTKHQVRGPLGAPIDARYCVGSFGGQSRVAIMEMSEASGMRRTETLDPERANTFGVGELLLAAAAKGAVEEIILGLGGSATNDGGFGMGAALGYRFLDAAGRELTPEPFNLSNVRRVVAPDDLRLPRIVGAADVRNPLLGERGATRVYGPQKGADQRQVEELEKGLENFARVVARDLGKDAASTPGAGAAGGLGYGLLCFCEARIENGFELVAEKISLAEEIGWADWVITGEGRIDAQTLHGKGPAGVAAMARKAGKPVVALAGSVADEDELSSLFTVVMPIVTRPMTLEEAMKKTDELLVQSGDRLGRIVRLMKRLEPGAR